MAESTHDLVAPRAQRVWELLRVRDRVDAAVNSPERRTTDDGYVTPGWTN
jgi:hypothetical protein